MFLTLDPPPSYSSGLFCPLLVLSQIQTVLLSWWHLSDWSLGWAVESGMGQSDPGCHWQPWQYQIPVSVGLCQKRSVHYCHCLPLEHSRKEACKCSSLKTKPPWKASQVWEKSLENKFQNKRMLSQMGALSGKSGMVRRYTTESHNAGHFGVQLLFNFHPNGQVTTHAICTYFCLKREDSSSKLNFLRMVPSISAARDS